MVQRPPSGTPDAVSGPTANTILLSGPRGSVPAGTSSYMTLLARPMPPMYSLYGSVDSVVMLPVVRLTRKILPVQPYETLSAMVPPRLKQPRCCVRLEARRIYG